MPPRKKAQAAAVVPALKDCNITFAASSIPVKSAVGKVDLSKMKTDIAAAGGEYVTKVSDCTHLVVTEAQYDKGGTKVEEAKGNSAIKIVDFEWLKQALAASSPVDETPYLLHIHGAASPTIATVTINPAPASTTSTNGASKKRQRDVKNEDDEDATDSKVDSKKTKTNGSAVPPAAMKIPLDVGLPHQNFTVYIDHNDPDGVVVYDATLNQSDSGKNANKFYRCQLLQDNGTKEWFAWTRWGRVGEFGQNSMLGPNNFDDALKDFKKKFKDKSGNSWEDRNGPIKAKKYAYIEKNYEESDDEDDEDKSTEPKNHSKTKDKKTKDEPEIKKEVDSKLHASVQRLMKLIFNQDFFNNTFDAFDYDARRMPLGKLSKSSLLRGYETLKELSTLVSNGTGNNSQIQNLSNIYLSLIPHVVPRNSRPPVLNTAALIKKEVDLLEALTDMQLAADLMKSANKEQEHADEMNILDRQFRGLGLQEMTPLEKSSTEFKECRNYLCGSVGKTHGTNYEVEDIFRIQRNGEFERFDSSAFAKIKNKNRRLLWHGSRTTNFGGILGQGLRIAPPEAPVNGYMFGKGIYLADMSSKSAGYCAAYNSGGTGLLLLCEAELGDPPLKLTGADSHANKTSAAQGLYSTWGVGRQAPPKWKDAAAVHKDLNGVQMPDVSEPAGDTNEPNAGLWYNEYIVYDVSQVKLRYLFRVKM